MRHEFWINRQLELIVSGPDFTERVDLSQPYALIGSHSSCDVVLPDQRLPARCFFTLLTPSGLLGVSLVRRSTAKFQLVNGDRGIRVGRFRIRFGQRPSQVDMARANAANQTLAESDTAGRLRWNIDGRRKFAHLKEGKPLLLGRHAPSRLCIDDPAVSTVHGVIYPHHGHVWLIDLGSTNGTRVGNQRICYKCLMPGDVFVVGTTSLKLGPVPTPLATSTRLPDGLPQDDHVRLESRCEAAQAEVEALTREVQQLRQMLEEYEILSKTLRQQTSELADLWQQLQEQQAAWARQQTETQERLSEQERQLAMARQSHALQVEQWSHEQESQRASWAESCRAEAQQQAKERSELERQRNAMQAEFSAEIEQLRIQRERLNDEQQSLNMAYEDLRVQQTEWTAHCQRLSADREELDRQQSEQWESLRRAKELMLVRRIRIQRDLQRRDTELSERQRLLAQQEQVLAERAAALQKKDKMGSLSRKVPLPPSMGESRQRNQAESAFRTVSAKGNAFELANPLLESADFTDLLNQVIDDIDTEDTPS